MVLAKLSRIFRTQVKCSNSKNEYVAIFIEVIFFSEEFAFKWFKSFYAVEILTRTTPYLSVSIAWVISKFYTYLHYPIFP